MPPILLLASLWATPSAVPLSRSKSCPHQKEHPSPERSLSITQQSRDQEAATERIPASPLQALHPSPALLAELHLVPVTAGQAPPPGPVVGGHGLQDWASAKLLSPRKLPPGPVCTVSLRALLRPSVTHNYPLSPGRLWGPSKDAN